MIFLYLSQSNTSYLFKFIPVRSSFTFFINVFFSLTGGFRPGTSISMTSPSNSLHLRLFTCQNHLNLFSRITDTSGLTPLIFVTSWLGTLSAKETSSIYRSLQRSQACFFVKLHVSVPYNRTEPTHELKLLEACYHLSGAQKYPFICAMLQMFLTSLHFQRRLHQVIKRVHNFNLFSI